MANITVRKQDGGPLATTTEWDPFRRMREMMRWDPFEEMFPRLTELAPQAATFMPAFEVKENKDSYVFKADLPGVKEADLEINVTGNRLTVNGKREAEHQEKGETYYTYERNYGSFLRTFTLPEGTDADHARAELKEGVLTLVVPKTEAAQPKKIAVKGLERTKA